MKKFLATMVILTASFGAKASVLNCQFENTAYTSDEEVIVNMNCNGEQMSLIGDNNSPCKAASNVAQFTQGLQSGDQINFVVDLRTSGTIDGASKPRLEVLSASRPGTTIKMITPTVTYHRQPRLCSSTHAYVQRQR